MVAVAYGMCTEGMSTVKVSIWALWPGDGQPGVGDAKNMMCGEQRHNYIARLGEQPEFKEMMQFLLSPLRINFVKVRVFRSATINREAWGEAEVDNHGWFSQTTVYDFFEEVKLLNSYIEAWLRKDPK